MKKVILFVTLICFICLIVANVVVSSSIADTGHRLKQIELEHAQLLEDNARLETQILESTSLTKLQNKAVELGYVKPTDVITITDTTVVVALNP